MSTRFKYKNVNTRSKHIFDGDHLTKMASTIHVYLYIFIYVKFTLTMTIIFTRIFKKFTH